MSEKKKKSKVVIKELQPKVKIIRQLERFESFSSSKISGLEKREQEIEREVTAFSDNAEDSNFLIKSSATPQQSPRTTGNTAIQQRPQEDSEDVKKWYSQSTRLTPGRDGERYKQVFKQDLTQQQDNLRRSTIGANQELQELGNKSSGEDDKYSLVKPEKKDSRRRYPWEV